MASFKTVLLRAFAVAAIGAGATLARAQDAPGAPPPSKAAPLDTGAKPTTESKPDGKSEAGTAVKKGKTAKKRHSHR